MLKDASDLYDLTYEKLFGLEKITEDKLTGKVRKISFKEKTVQNILEANTIQTSTFWHWHSLRWSNRCREIGKLFQEY